MSSLRKLPTEPANIRSPKALYSLGRAAVFGFRDPETRELAAPAEQAYREFYEAEQVRGGRQLFSVSPHWVNFSSKMCTSSGIDVHTNYCALQINHLLNESMEVQKA